MRGKKQVNYHSKVYPTYQYFLPVHPVMTQNAKWRLSGIQKIKVIETVFESTALVVAYGKDIFVTKVQPDNTFDLLSEDFNYTLLGVVTVVMTVLVCSSRSWYLSCANLASALRPRKGTSPPNLPALINCCLYLTLLLVECKQR